jgi:general secretion pathway protein D
MFVAALEISRLVVVWKGNVHYIMAIGNLPPEQGTFVYKPANATDLAAILTNFVARSQTLAQTVPGARSLFRPLSKFEAPVQVFTNKGTNSTSLVRPKAPTVRCRP